MSIINDIKLDIKTIKERDPAARSTAEVLLMHQGLHAIMCHRIAHRLYVDKHYFVARLISQLVRFFTLIEIHPGAVIGKGVVIDHGCGVVIGETAVVGDYCTIYQGVTLGGVGTKKGKRHPTLGKNVTVGAGAKILGSFVVGDNCKIAANAVLLKPLDSDTTAAGIPAKPVKVGGVSIAHMQEMTADPRAMLGEIEDLKQRVKILEENK